MLSLLLLLSLLLFLVIIIIYYYYYYYIYTHAYIYIHTFTNVCVCVCVAIHPFFFLSFFLLFILFYITFIYFMYTFTSFLKIPLPQNRHYFDYLHINFLRLNQSTKVLLLLRTREYLHTSIHLEATVWTYIYCGDLSAWRLLQIISVPAIVIISRPN